MFGLPSHLGWHLRLDGDFPFVNCRGRPWPFVEGGANGPLWPFVDRGCGRLYPLIDPGGGPSSMVMMGPRSRSSILVVGFVDVSGPSSSTVDPCGGSSLRFVGDVRRERV